MRACAAGQQRPGRRRPKWQRAEGQHGPGTGNQLEKDGGSDRKDLVREYIRDLETCERWDDSIRRQTAQCPGHESEAGWRGSEAGWSNAATERYGGGGGKESRDDRQEDDDIAAKRS